jgi:hypothetical protein
MWQITEATPAMDALGCAGITHSLLTTAMARIVAACPHKDDAAFDGPGHVEGSGPACSGHSLHLLPGGGKKRSMRAHGSGF